MGKRIIISESEKLNIQNLYKGLINEQPENRGISDIPLDNRGGTPDTPPPKKQGPRKEKPNPRKYLPISDKFCDIRLGKAQLKKNAKSDLVKLFQEALNACGIEPLKPLEIDGDFGDFTKGAVKAFQEENRLKVDGAIGIETSGKMCELGCIPEEICNKCQGKKGGKKGDKEGDKEGGQNTVGPIKEGDVNISCQKVQSCISEFMSEYNADSCLDTDMLRKLLQCVGVGQCFEEGKVTVKEGCTNKGIDLCSIPYEQLESGRMHPQVIGYFYDPKSNKCVMRSAGGGPFNQEQKCIQCCVRK